MDGYNVPKELKQHNYIKGLKLLTDQQAEQLKQDIENSRLDSQIKAGVTAVLDNYKLLIDELICN